MIVSHCCITVLLYAFQMQKFFYSDAVVVSKQSSNGDPWTSYRSSDDRIRPETAEELHVGGRGSAVRRSAASADGGKLPQGPSVGDRTIGGTATGDRWTKRPADRAKRAALELAEERPPEGTYRPPSTDRVEPLTVPPTPPIPSVPSAAVPRPPPDVQDVNREQFTPTVTTAAVTDVPETTTEDYGNIGEPECNYDPFAFVLKCGLNLITSIFGLSDTCCKSIF